MECLLNNKKKIMEKNPVCQRQGRGVGLVRNTAFISLPEAPAELPGEIWWIPLEFIHYGRASALPCHRRVCSACSSHITAAQKFCAIPKPPKIMGSRHSFQGFL